MAEVNTQTRERYRLVAVAILGALVPVLVMSAHQGWLNWSIAVTGVLVVLTALGALAFTIGGTS